MNKSSLTILLFFVLLFGERVNYWNLGISINDESTIIVQKKVDLDDFCVAPVPYQKKLNSKNPTYTLKTNYIMEPTFINSKEENHSQKNNNQNIKDLILNGEYFKSLDNGINKGTPERLKNCFYACGIT